MTDETPSRTRKPAKPATKPAKQAAEKAPAKKAPARKAPAKRPVEQAPAVEAVPTPPPPAPEPDRPLAIEVKGLRKSFKGGVNAVNGVDLEVREGEVFGFLGPNGAGKTTTVRMLCTLLPVTGGSARVAGADVVADAAAVRRRIGVALQEIGLDPIQSGREILQLQCGMYGMNTAQATKRTNELLELVGLTEAADRRTKTYSGGMKRRLDLASALVHEPRVLFLTTQYLEEADQLCARLAIIDRGTIVAAGTPEELKSAMGHDVVTISIRQEDHEAACRAVEGLRGVQQIVEERDALALYVDNGAEAIPALVRLLDQAGVTASALSVARPTLDDVFLKATGRRLEGDDETVEEESK